MRSEKQIVEQTNELARQLYELRGFIAPKGFKFYEATRSREIEAWKGACIAQELLTETDVENALAELDIEGC